ncbi:MAG: UDP-N-acetylenolpyruvoylglucosamine reductase [Nitrospira bacterium HGW-Nitrospira-1]|nr:MAG: UDP-N-acetylenolpyruvoylglucosamine reductase [Nitrospira bacterium HGW-Nitrospira-1]
MLISRREWEDALGGIYRGDAEFGAPMKNHTSLAVGGPADVLLSPADPVSLKNVMLLLQKKNILFLPLGGGTNVLVRDGGIEGAVINFKAFRMMQVIHDEGNYAGLFVEAGAPLQMLVNFCKEKGYAGIEGLTGIPGTFGGAICGNAGSYGCEIRDVIQSVVIMSGDGKIDRFDAEDLGFGYRRSAIKPTDIVLNANIILRKDDKDAVEERVQKYLAEKMKTQPISARSAGCVFKNPEGMSAGKLIDEAGCKGMKIGGIEVSGVHANFFINSGNGRAADYISLMHEVSLIVEKKCGIVLEPEIRVVGRE